MSQTGWPARRHHRHRRRLAVRRRPRALLGPRQPRLQRHARDHRLRRHRIGVPRRRAGLERDHRRRAGDRRRRAVGRWLPRRSEALFARGAGRRDRRRARRGSTPGCASASPTPASSSAAAAAASTSASGSTTTSSSSAAARSRRTRFPCRSSAWCRARFRFRCGCAASATCCRAAARARPTRIGYARGAHPLGRGRGRAVGRHRRVRDAGHDVRLLAHEGRVDGLQRSAGGRVAAVRSRPRRVRARRGRVDGRARARGSRAGARRDASTRRSTATARPATPITACRWRPTARRSSARSRWRSSARAGRAKTIGYVNYHGTSTVLNDAVESRCVRQVFGAHADRLAGSSVKSMIGHPQGASGAAGVVTAALAISRQLLPPTINLDDPDPACDLDFIPASARAAWRSKPRSATASGSDRRTARSSSGASEPWRQRHRGSLQWCTSAPRCRRQMTK